MERLTVSFKQTLNERGGGIRLKAGPGADVSVKLPTPGVLLPLASMSPGSGIMDI